MAVSTLAGPDLCGLSLGAEAHADSMSVISMTVVALSNTYGLFAIAFLLGFGLMELPKQTWMVGLAPCVAQGQPCPC